MSLNTIAENVATVAAILRIHAGTRDDLDQQLIDVADVLAITIDTATGHGHTVTVAMPPATAATLDDAAALLHRVAIDMATAGITGRAWAKATFLATSVAMAIRDEARP